MREDVVRAGAGLESRERAGLAEADAMAEALSREHERVARLLHAEQRAAQRSDAEPRVSDVAEDLAAHDERARAAQQDLLRASGVVAAGDLDPIELGADRRARVGVERGVNRRPRAARTSTRRARCPPDRCRAWPGDRPGPRPPQTAAALLVWPPQSAWNTARAGASANQSTSPAVFCTAARAAALHREVLTRAGS